MLYSEQPAKDASAEEEDQSLKASPSLDEAHTSGQNPRSFELVMEELASVSARQSELVAEARASCTDECSRAHYEEQIASLQAQLASAQSELASSKAEQLSSKAQLERAEASAQKVAAEKLSVMAELAQERATVERLKLDAAWALKYLEENKEEHFSMVEELRSNMDCALKLQEEKLRKLSIEFDEELYPHLVQSIAERRYAFLSYFN